MNNYIISSIFVLNLFSSPKSNKGFTLIELLVVMIFIGVLSAVSLPIFFQQANRARQTEAEIALGAINRAQQTHRLNSPSFGTLQQIAEAGNISFDIDGAGNINTAYYQFIPIVQNAAVAQVDANALIAFTSDLSDYQSAVFQNTNDGSFNTIMCRGLTPADDTPIANADPASAATACTGNSELVR